MECYGAPQYVLQGLPYASIRTYSPVIAYAHTNSPEVLRIPKQDITFNVPNRFQYGPAIQLAAPVQYAAPVPTSSQFSVANQVQNAVSVPISSQFSVATPIQNAIPVPTSNLFSVASPVQFAASAHAASPVVVAADPEHVLAPEPPLPSVSEPFVGGQFHAQDEAGQYSFGHWGGPNTRVETRDVLGRTSGSFAYINPSGDVEVRKYGASPATGFKAAASDLPVDTPEVAHIKDALARLARTPSLTLV
nr:uncharacterized protein LOC128703718 [Cherax quadricarinatus]